MSPAMELLHRTLARRDLVSTDEMKLLADLTQRVATYPKEAEVIEAHSRPSSSCLLTAGIASRSVILPDGKRQLTALHVPGDFVDLHGLMLKTMDHSVVALSECAMVFVPHRELIALGEKAPHLTRLLWLLTMIDAAIQRRMTALIGRYTPLQRLSHLICELYLRLEAVDLVAGQAFDLPVRQSEIADLLGLSLVHTNRTIQELRATGLATWKASKVTVPDFEKLARLGRFDPTYLNLLCEQR